MRDASTAGETIDVFKPVIQNGETLGTLHFRAHYDVTARVLGFLKILGLVMLLSIVAAVFAAGWLPERDHPAAERHSHHGATADPGADHAVRAPEGQGDEFGAMALALNTMLGEIQSRTEALESANDALKREVTGRLVIERALRDSERLYRAIGESIDYGVWICDAQGRNTYASDSFLKLCGITQAEYSDFRWSAFLHPDDREETIRSWQECVRSGGFWYPRASREGRRRPVPLHPGAGRSDSRRAGLHYELGRHQSRHRAHEANRASAARGGSAQGRVPRHSRGTSCATRSRLFVIAARLLGLPAANEDQRTWARDIIARQVRHMALLLTTCSTSRITRGSSS